MALPSGEANKELIDEVSGLSDVINRLLFKTDNIRSDMNANLFAIKINSDAMAHSLSTLEAMAELEFERMDDGDAEKEDVDLESPDAEKLGEGGPTIELLTKIAEATRETAESTKVLADAAREESENVLIHQTVNHLQTFQHRLMVLQKQTVKRIEASWVLWQLYLVACLVQ